MTSPLCLLLGSLGLLGREEGRGSHCRGGAQSTQLVPSSPTLFIAPEACMRTPESQDFNYFPRPADSSLIPFRSQEILHPESHHSALSKEFHPPSAPSVNPWSKPHLSTPTLSGC